MKRPTGITLTSAAALSAAWPFFHSELRFVRFSRVPEGRFNGLLLKKESIGTGGLPKAGKVDLESVKKGKASLSISKSIVLWLYRSVAIVDERTSITAAFALLRSDQEGTKPTLA